MNNPKYPIYIISKGRADSRMTSRSLENLLVPYRIVIEESEYDDYAAVIDPKKILVMPSDFRENPKYAIPDELGQMGGSIPARNFVWEHSISEGHAKHWILDDNILHFYRLHKNVKVRMTDGTSFRCCEDFTDRYENVRISGMNYTFFCPKDVKKAPYYINTRVYSCILIDNSLDIRWRGKYNEDTDLSLRVLKNGDCTILFNAFCCGKTATLRMKGGNSETVYNMDNAEQFDNRLVFAETLKHHHPDVTTVTQKWGRWHHHVNYDGFIKANKLKFKEGLDIPQGVVNNYGLKLVRLPETDDMDLEEEFDE